MACKRVQLMGWNSSLIAAVAGMFLIGVSGCAGESPKPAPTMTQDQVRSNADKAFDKLKQEEKNRAGGSGAPPY
jgi:hypothetical protein